MPNPDMNMPVPMFYVLIGLVLVATHFTAMYFGARIALAYIFFLSEGDKGDYDTDYYDKEDLL